MFYRLSALAIMAGLVAAAPAQAQEAFPNGVWSDSDRNVTVRIGPCPANGGANTQAFCGVVLSDTRPGPAANPPNHMLLRDLRQTRGIWRGKAVDGTAQLNLTLQPRGTDAINARYCLGFLCENDIWTRAPSGRPASR
jgi:uncharacterized protein (DUF2147 family)